MEALKRIVEYSPRGKSCFVEDTMVGFDKKQLHIEAWIPDCKPKAVILVLHSIGDHINRYKYFGEYFSTYGFAVIGIDMHGCGKSQGRKGKAKFNHLLCDVKQFIDYVEFRFPNIPKIVYGHGLGGNLALTYATRNNFALMAIISSSPIIRVINNFSPWFVYTIRSIMKLYPSFRIKSRIKGSDLTHDTERVSAYNKDTLVCRNISANLLFNIQKSGNYLLHNKHKVNMPLLLMHGSNDNIASWHATTDFAKNTSNNTTLKIWKGAFHELHNESEKEDIFEFILEWIEHLPGIH